MHLSLPARTIALFFALYTSARAASPYQLVEHETASHMPTDWRFHSSARGDELLHLKVGLQQSNTDYLRTAHQVSDPYSAHYGKHLSAQELREATSHLDKASCSVRSWLESHGINDAALRGEWMHFTTSVAKAREVMNAQFAKYSYQGQAPVLRTTSYSIPSNMTKDIDFIYPTMQFFGSQTRDSSKLLKSRQHVPTGPPTCDNSTCPKQLRDMYKINYQPPNKSKSRLGIAGFLEQYANQQDLTTFLKKYGLNKTVPSYSPAYKFNVELINGGKNPSSINASGVEAMLDLDYSMAFTEPLDVTYYSTGGRPPTLDQHGVKPVPANESQNEPYLAFLEYIIALKEPPQVISMSYSDNEQTVPIKYAQRVCDLFGRLAARGVSIIGSSGDGGASGTSNSDCIGPDGKKHFLPTFPSSCPWITSVGATASYGGAADFSSGGFSNYFGVPAWQKNATQQYIKSLNGRHNGYYNKTGRGIPDVSLLGDDYLIVSGGYDSAHDGTSASTPVFAAIVTLLNDLRLRAGKPVLGHLNPWLYTANVRAAFTDVKDGSQNTGCADSTSFETGFEALAGWDAVTGIGTPDFSKLRKLI